MLENNTPMVKTLEAETREYMRDYHKTWVHFLRPEVINNVMLGGTGVGQSLVLFLTLKNIFLRNMVGTLTDVNKNWRLPHMFFFLEYASELLLTQEEVIK